MSLPDPLHLVGTVIADKYAVERVVGEGGFAIVYRAIHRVWQRPVAIKVFRALGGLVRDRHQELVDSFVQEGRLLAELSERSAAICQARDVGLLTTSDGLAIPYMVLEWLEGRSLDAVLADERCAGLPPRSPEAAVALLEPAAEALALAHKKGIAHRDVKPANLFIIGDPRGEPTVKLLDFGIAKVVQDAQRDAGAFARTQGVMSSFTPAYGAPEQFSRAQGATGPWTDVFALALILTELLTHQPPLLGDDLTQLAFAAMDTQRRPTPRAFDVPVPEAVEAVLRRALTVKVQDRYASMGEFWTALRSALSLDPASSFVGTDSSRSDPHARTALGAPTPTGEIGVPRRTPAMPGTEVPFATMRVTGPPPPRSRAPIAIVTGVGLVLSVGLGGFLLRPQGQPPPPVAVASSAPPIMSIAAAPEPTCPPGMTKIPAGRFFMGSDDRREEDDERPAHQVILSAYCMDTTEVTVEQYKACSDRGGCKRAPTENDWEGITPQLRKIYDPLCNIREPETRGLHPINCIDWELADAYCKATSRRLPTEAEWEYATRGSDGRKYPWGDDAPMGGGHLNACGKECVAWGKKHPDPDYPLVAMYPADDGFPTTAPVGSFPNGASPFGLQDVVGNVWEWVSDWHARYTGDAVTNPTGPESGTERVLRGGAWNGSKVAWVRPTYRFKSDPKLRSHGIGLRCAMSL
jgi:eukaryotic-like serine/threonine-protein kinase